MDTVPNSGRLLDDKEESLEDSSQEESERIAILYALMELFTLC